MLGVISYFTYVSTLQTASIAIMQFTAFNSYSTIFVQSEMAWPNPTTLANLIVLNIFYQGLASSSFFSSIQTIGLLNNTLYNILTTTNSSFTNATMNATFLQSTCGLLSNLTFSNLRYMKQPISSIHLKVSPRLLTRVKDKREGENLWVQESYSESCWRNSKRTWLKFSGSNFGLYILLIMFVHDCIGSTDTVCIRKTLSPGLWVAEIK